MSIPNSTSDVYGERTSFFLGVYTYKNPGGTQRGLGVSLLFDFFELLTYKLIWNYKSSGRCWPLLL